MKYGIILDTTLSYIFTFHPIGVTLISHQAFASSASVLTTQHYILQLSNTINEDAKHLPCGHEIPQFFIAGMRSVRLGEYKSIYI